MTLIIIVKRHCLMCFLLPFSWIHPKWCSICSFTFHPAIRHSMKHTFDYTVTLFSPSAAPISKPCLLRLQLIPHDKSFSTADGIFQPIPASVKPHGISFIRANLRKKYRKNAENSRQNRHCKFWDNFSNRT